MLERNQQTFSGTFCPFSEYYVLAMKGHGKEIFHLRFGLNIL